MGIVNEIRQLTASQRNAFLACFLGWSLDAFDFFILTFCLRAIAADFHTGLTQVAEAVFWTLVMRPVGALLFGILAERYGRRSTLMVNIVCFSVFELASAFAPTLPVLLVCRALFGIAMGGEWGVGAALALESLPARGRGFFSGLLQEGYSVGNLLAAAVFGLLFPHLHGTGLLTNWRVMFMVGTLPALLVFYIRSKVAESPAWLNAHNAGAAPQPTRPGFADTVFALRRYWGTFLFLVVLMLAFMSFSHGTQDLYPTFLERDHHLPASVVGTIVVISNVGAILGGICCGGLSEIFGRRRTIITAALLSIPVIPLWAWTHTAWMIAAGAFVMQFLVQGAWGIVPAHLNELSPAPVRALLPGLVYQLGSLLSSRNIVLQTILVTRYAGGALAPVLAGTVVVVALVMAVVTALGDEAKGADLSGVGAGSVGFDEREAARV